MIDLRNEIERVLEASPFRLQPRAFLAALAICHAAPGIALAEPAKRGLSVAILDITEAPKLSPPPPKKAQLPAWRTSFGAEIEDPVQFKVEYTKGPLAALKSADAVLIQGIKAAATLRRLFPPRTWRLIVSRGATRQAGMMPSWSKPSAADLPPATAIAIRAKEGLRVTGRAFGLHADASTSIQATDVLPADATAVRISDGTRNVWLVSVSLPPSCHAPNAACPAREGLEAWLAAKRAGGEATIVGGSLAGIPAGDEGEDASPGCASHGIRSDLSSHVVPPPAEAELSKDGMGCLSIVRVAEDAGSEFAPVAAQNP